MIERKTDFLLSRDYQNDLIACNLLKGFDRFKQFVILHSIDAPVLQRVFDAAIDREAYEICQVIKELMEKRKRLNGI
jgi:uncharacterized protein YktA (UPF0223 family)